ncbi:RNA polymerase subunit sigma-70 [Niabella ginsenosidivorans]|uniref:RNA polymerase subunit sigma-70 n=2 Tax=Niabella ginsenosidivorans TaxID=1176587 RepID=A0A1A9I7L9_9BACT|nr:RNA polymerase subunit sigma-70 [Niabella ginsenosidivorans]
MERNEEIIIRQLREGSERAYKYLYDHYYTTLCHTANGYLQDPDQSELIVGDLIFHLWEIRESLQIETSLLGYLVSAVRNRCINYLSSSRIRHEVPVSYLLQKSALGMAAFDYATPKDYVMNGLLEKELDGEFANAINALPPECKIVFVKSRFEKKKYEDISQELSISVNTVKYHMKNALRLLREKLEKYVAILLVLFFFK